MTDKKATGIEWYALAICGLIFGTVIILNSVFTVKIPEVGEHSLAMSKTFESRSTAPIIIDALMKKINESE